MSDKEAGKRDIVHRLCEKAAMIHFGEKIEFGSETKLMWEAADEIERLRAALAAARPHILEEAARIAELAHIDLTEEDDGTILKRTTNVAAAAAIRAAKEGE